MQQTQQMQVNPLPLMHCSKPMLDAQHALLSLRAARAPALQWSLSAVHVVSGCRQSDDLVLRKKKQSLHLPILALAAFLAFYDSLLFLCSRW